MHSLMFDKLILFIESLATFLAGEFLLAVHPLVMTFHIVKITDCH